MSPTSFGEADGKPISSFNIVVTDNLGEFSEIWPRTDCTGPAHCFVFQCADLLEVWCDTIGKARGIQARFVGVFDRTGRPVFLLPLGIERQRGIRMLRFLDGGVSDYNAPVVFDAARSWPSGSMERMWGELIRSLPAFDIAAFDKMPVDICGAPNPLVELGSMPFAESGHLTSISGSWDEYAAKRLPHRKDSRYQRRRLCKLGKVAFRIAETRAERRRILEAVMRQKSRRCIETTGVDDLDRPGYRQYYSAMTERFTWPGPLLIASLEVDGNIIAAGWHLIFDRRFIFFVTTFEGGEWARFSPGRLLLEDLLEWSFANGISIFDFTVGDESYKLDYSDQKLLLKQARIPVSVIGKAYQFGRNTKLWRLLRPMVKRAISK
jgi:CelD/BcsL family acetyltransferase involved in cellulose biosynthesis